MFENIKTDIIYYNTPTDFEMEFNLCGCCRMRLLNDKCDTKKGLLTSLSRAVARSRIIIITAPLFTDENIIGTIASSIGTDTETLNNKEFNITSDANIDIIKGSTPLVTDDGIFGGCIIECGPQTMIILTDNKSVRKTIMKTLIHPYVAELFSFEKEDNSTELYQGDLVTEETIETEPEEEPQEYEEELVLEDIDPQEETAEDNGYYLSQFEELITNEEITNEITEENYADEYDDDDEDDEYYTEEANVKTSPFNIWLLIISVIVILAIAVLCVSIFYIPTKLGETPTEYMRQVFNTIFG